MSVVHLLSFPEIVGPLGGTKERDHPAAFGNTRTAFIGGATGGSDCGGVGASCRGFRHEDTRECRCAAKVKTSPLGPLAGLKRLRYVRLPLAL